MQDRFVEAANAAWSINPARETCPQDRAGNLFKIAIYGEVRRLFAEGNQREIEQLFIHYADDRRKAVSFNSNPYNWILDALRHSGELDQELTADDVNAIGWQLMHAHNHHIDPALLIGFLYQTAASGPKKRGLIKAVGATYHEPWLEDYEQRLLLGLPERLRPKK